MKSEFKSGDTGYVGELPVTILAATDTSYLVRIRSGTVYVSPDGEIGDTEVSSAIVEVPKALVASTEGAAGEVRLKALVDQLTAEAEARMRKNTEDLAAKQYAELKEHTTSMAERRRTAEAELTSLKQQAEEYQRLVDSVPELRVIAALSTVDTPVWFVTVDSDETVEVFDRKEYGARSGRNALTIPSLRLPLRSTSYGTNKPVLGLGTETCTVTPFLTREEAVRYALSRLDARSQSKLNQDYQVEAFLNIVNSYKKLTGEYPEHLGKRLAEALAESIRVAENQEKELLSDLERTRKDLENLRKYQSDGITVETFVASRRQKKVSIEDGCIRIRS